MTETNSLCDTCQHFIDGKCAKKIYKPSNNFSMIIKKCSYWREKPAQIIDIAELVKEMKKNDGEKR